MPRNFYLLSILILITASALKSAGYVDNELFMIPWGESSDQLRIEPLTFDDPGTPEDSTDDIPQPGSGPSLTFIDEAGNVLVGSYVFQQLKGFTNAGQLIFDYSYGSEEYKQDMYLETIAGIYVDSLKDLYILGFPDRDFVAKTDYEGNVIDSLLPFGSSSGTEIMDMSWSTNGSIFFYDFTRGWKMLSNGEYFAGGSSGFLANNGSFYAAIIEDSVTIKFNKFENPDSAGHAESRQYTNVSFSSEAIYSCKIMNGGDGDHLFVEARRMDYITYEVWVFDMNYVRLDRIILPSASTQYDWRVPPFVWINGSVYEFRVMDDGLHVIKWTKE